MTNNSHIIKISLAPPLLYRILITAADLTFEHRGGRRTKQKELDHRTLVVILAYDQPVIVINIVPMWVET